MEIPESARLTQDEHLKLHEDFFGEGSDGPEIDDTDLCIKVANAAAEKAYRQGREDKGSEMAQWLHLILSYPTHILRKALKEKADE